MVPQAIEAQQSSTTPKLEGAEAQLLYILSWVMTMKQREEES